MRTDACFFSYEFQLASLKSTQNHRDEHLDRLHQFLSLLCIPPMALEDMKEDKGAPILLLACVVKPRLTFPLLIKFLRVLGSRRSSIQLYAM